MTATWQTWLISAAAATGVVGGGAVGLAAASAPSHAKPTRPAPRPAAVDATQLQAQVAQLLAEDKALHAALSQARLHLGAEVTASESSLRAVRAQLAAAQGALAAAGRAPAARAAAVTATTPHRLTPASASTQAPAPAPAPRPSAHTTTGASGTGSGTAGEDDGGGHDD